MSGNCIDYFSSYIFSLNPQNNLWRLIVLNLSFLIYKIEIEMDAFLKIHVQKLGQQNLMIWKSYSSHISNMSQEILEKTSLKISAISYLYD